MIARLRPAALAALMAVLLGTALVALPSSAGASGCYDQQPPPTGTAGTAWAATANPLDNQPWTAGHARKEALWQAYCDETNATNKALLKPLAYRPRAFWFNESYPTYSTATKYGIRYRVHQFIADSQHGDPDTRVTMSIFRLWPRGEAYATTPLTSAQVDAYKAWIREFEAGMGASRVAIVLEPDLGIVQRQLSGANQRTRFALVRYAAWRLGRARHPNAAVYIDGSSADWLHVGESAQMLRRAGIGYVRGFALGATHYSRLHRTSTTDPEQVGEVRYAYQVVRALNATGLASLQNKRAVIDTSDNLRGFTMRQYLHSAHSGIFDNADICTSKSDRVCVSLGIPPTWQVGRDLWVRLGQLDAREQYLARRYVDGYLWFGRAWLHNQASPFEKSRALGMVRTSTIGWP